MTKFSIIIPTYNCARFLLAALKSALNQSYPALEIIVIDDGSNDETKTVLEPLRDKMTYLYKENGGPGSARNLGISQATGEYIVFLDSDDLLLPWALETYAEAISDADSPSFILTRAISFANESQLTGLRREPLNVSIWDDYIQAAVARYRITIAAAIRTDVLRRHTSFDTFSQTSEEQDLYLRIGAEKNFIYINEPRLYAYRTNESSLTMNLAAHEGGLELLLRNERRGQYPGGAARQKERSIILSRIIRYKMRRCLKNGYHFKSYQIYRRSLPYLLRTNRKAAFHLFQLLLRNLLGRFTTLKSKLWNASLGSLLS